MIIRSLFRPAVALAAGVWLAGCTLHVDGDDSAPAPDEPDRVGQCLRDTIEECYLDQLPASVCAALVETRCNLGGDPTDPDDPGDPQPNDCWREAFEGCLAMNGDPETCATYADQVCGDPTQPPPPPDCWQRVFDECVATSGDPMICAEYATLACGDPTQPPPCDDPPPPPDCDPMNPPPGGCEPWPPPPPPNCDPMNPPPGGCDPTMP